MRQSKTPAYVKIRHKPLKCQIILKAIHTIKNWYITRIFGGKIKNPQWIQNI